MTTFLILISLIFVSLSSLGNFFLIMRLERRIRKLEGLE